MCVRARCVRAYVHVCTTCVYVRVCVCSHIPPPAVSQTTHKGSQTERVCARVRTLIHSFVRVCVCVCVCVPPHLLSELRRE